MQAVDHVSAAQGGGGVAVLLGDLDAGSTELLGEPFGGFELPKRKLRVAVKVEKELFQRSFVVLRNRPRQLILLRIVRSASEREVAQEQLDALGEEELRRFIARVSKRQLADASLAPLLGRGLESLVEGGRHQEVFTQALRIALVMLNDNRDLIRGNVQRDMRMPPAH